MSQVWKKFEQIMSDKGLVKEAAEKEKDYNVEIPAAGPDTKVEEDGWELVEIAHPEQVQVANSRLNDGIVENGVEAQKIMIDVATRPSRGVLAEVMQTLVKAANTLEDDLTEESLKLAKEIDDVLEKLAQQSFYTPEGQFNALLSATQNFVKHADNLNWARFQFVFSIGEKTEQKELVEKIVAHLRSYVAQAKGMVNAEQKIQWSNAVASIIKANSDGIATALKSAREGTVFIDNAKETQRAWADLVETAYTVQEPASKKEVAPAAKEIVEERKPMYSTVPKMQPQQDMAHRGPTGRHNYSAHGPEVIELQKAVGLGGKDLDGKFGPQTFAAVMQASKDDYDLRNYLHENPALVKGFENWSDEAVSNALRNVQQFKHPASAEQSSLPPLVPAPLPPLVPAPDTNIRAKQQLGSILQQKYPNAEIENDLVYLNGKGKEGPIFRILESGKWQQVK